MEERMKMGMDDDEKGEGEEGKGELYQDSGEEVVEGFGTGTGDGLSVLSPGFFLFQATNQSLPEWKKC